MFHWRDNTYDNDWLCVSDGYVSFYLCDSAVGIPANTSELSIRNPEFIEGLLKSLQKQKDIFSNPEGKKHLSRFKFLLQYQPEDEYSTFQILESPFLDEHESGSYQKLYHEWFLNQRIEEAKKEGETEAAQRYTDTIDSLKMQIARLNRIIRQDDAIAKGGSKELIEQLLEKSRIEHERQMEELRQAKAELEKLRQHTDYGYVYLFCDIDSNTYKIGKSKNPDSRLAQIRTSTASKVECICTIETNDMTTLESELHSRFADKRIRGEWFQLTIDDVTLIKQRIG